MTTSHRDKLAGYSSVFDEPLRRNRERMNEKMQGFSRLRKYSPEISPEYSQESPTAAPRYTPAPTQTVPPRPSPPPKPGGSRPAALPPHGEGARLLTARFGDKWRHEITEAGQESGEAVVKCRVTVPEEGLSQTHTGRAKISKSTRPGPGPGKEGRSIQGTADGIPFTIRAGSGSNGGTGNKAEEAAFQAALEMALLECAKSFGAR